MKKVIKYALFGLLALCGIALVVLYIIFPTDTKNTISYFWDLLNKPLPIIGITTVALLTFVWQFFSHSSYGKKRIQQVMEEKDKLQEEYKKFIEEADSKINELARQNELLREQLSHVCELSLNKKIKDYGKELLEYGKETIDSETKAD